MAKLNKNVDLKQFDDFLEQITGAGNQDDCSDSFECEIELSSDEIDYLADDESVSMKADESTDFPEDENSYELMKEGFKHIKVGSNNRNKARK